MDEGAPASLWDDPTFSLFLGGPLYQLLRRLRLADDTMSLIHRRTVMAVMILWAPLAGLSALGGRLIGSGPELFFLKDFGTNLRFLVVVPLLVVAESIVHRRMAPLVDQFRARRLIPPDHTARYAAAFDAAMRWRNSVLAEVILLVVVYAVGLLVTKARYVDLGGGAWYASTAQGKLSLAGWWLVFVSLPLFQFLLLRWYYRLFIWAKFLWQVSRLDLSLNATHPDKAGGIGFLGLSMAAFVPIAAAHGVLVAGMLANRIFYAGDKLLNHKLDILGIALLLLLVFAGPLLVFAPVLARVKRRGLGEYGALGQVYVRAFHAKWIEPGAKPDEPLLGTGDIQSLADLGNSFAVADQMRLVPLSRASVVLFLLAFLAPLAPLLLTVMPVDQLIGKLLGLVF